MPEIPYRQNVAYEYSFEQPSAGSLITINSQHGLISVSLSQDDMTVLEANLAMLSNRDCRTWMVSPISTDSITSLRFDRKDCVPTWAEHVSGKSPCRHTNRFAVHNSCLLISPRLGIRCHSKLIRAVPDRVGTMIDEVKLRPISNSSSRWTFCASRHVHRLINIVRNILSAT